MALDPAEDRRRRAERARLRYAADPEAGRARMRDQYAENPAPARRRAEAARRAEKVAALVADTSLTLALHESVPAPVPYDGNTSATSWQDRAACVGMDPDLFFPEGVPSSEVRAACLGCPVRAECLGYALSFPSSRLLGVWGGTTQAGRTRVRRAERDAS